MDHGAFTRVTQGDTEIQVSFKTLLKLFQFYKITRLRNLFFFIGCKTNAKDD